MGSASKNARQLAINADNAGVSVNSYRSSTIGATVATMGATVAVTALNAALSMGIGILVQFAAEGLSHLINAYQEFAERQKEAAESSKEFNDTLSNIEDYQKKINDLRESLEKEGISQADATEKRKELLKIKDELFEMYGDEADKRNAITDAINGEADALLRLRGIVAQKNNFNNSKEIQGAENYLNEQHSYTVDLKGIYSQYGNLREIDEFLNNYVQAHNGTSYNGGGKVGEYTHLAFSGTRDEIIQQITDFNSAIEEEINTNKNLTEDEIQKLRNIQISNSETVNWIADKDNQTLENNHTIIEAAAKNALLIDHVYSDLYQKYKDAQSDYNDAVAKGDKDAIEKTYTNVKSAYDNLINGINHDVGQVNKDYITEYVDSVQEQFESSNIDVSLPIKIKTDIDSNNIPDGVIKAIDNLNNEQKKVVDWGLTEYGNVFDTTGDSFVQTVFGNIDMDKRAIITWSDELKKQYEKELNSWEYNPENGAKDTVFGGWDVFNVGSPNDDKASEVAIAFSPIMIDENGQPRLLDKTTVNEYLNGIIKEATHDGVIDEQVLFRLDAQGTSEYGEKNGIKGIIAGIDTNLTNGNDADRLSKLMHFSGTYGALGSEVGENMSDLQAYADSLGVSLDSLISAFMNLGYIQKENIEVNKNATFSITEYSDSISNYQKNIKTLQNAYEKLTKGELSENDVLDLVVSKFPKLLNYTGDLEKGIKALADEEYDELLSKLKQVDTANLSEEDLNVYKSLIGYIEQINNGFSITIDNLTQIHSKIKSTSSLISSLQSMAKEINDNGYLSLSSITTILTDDNYSSLRPYLDDVVSLSNQINTLIKEQKEHYNELANQTINRFNMIDEETKKIEKENNIDLSNYEKLSNEKKNELRNTNALMLSQIDDFIGDIKTKYDVDVRNFKDATSTKLAILDSFKRTQAFKNIEAMPEISFANSMGSFMGVDWLGEVSNNTIKKANEELRELDLTWEDYVQYKKNGTFSYSSNKSLDDNLQLIYEQYKNSGSNITIDWDKINSIGSNTSSTNSDITSSASEANKYFDWIERRLKRFANVTKEVFSKVKDYITFNGKNSQLSNAINAIRDEIAVNEQSYEYYMNEANAVGLDPYWQWFVENGGGNISNIQDNELSEKISRYQELYDKAIGCRNAISDLKETELGYATQMLGNVDKYFSNRISYVASDADYYNSLDTETQNFTKNYAEIRKSYNNQIAETENKSRELLNTLNNLVSSGSIKYQSDEWYEWIDKINQCNVEVRNLKKTLHSLYAEELQDIKDFWENRVSNLDNTISYINTSSGDNTQNIAKNYKEIKNAYSKQISYTNKEIVELQNKLNESVRSGDIQEYSDKWYEWVNIINQAKEKVIELKKNIHQLAVEELQDIKSYWENKSGVSENAVSYINTVSSDTTRKNNNNYKSLSTEYNNQLIYATNEVVMLQKRLNDAIKSGDIQKYSDDWYEWTNSIEQAKEKIIELRKNIHLLAVKEFEDIKTKYNNLISFISNKESLLNESINQTKAQGYIVSTKYYEALIQNERNNISNLSAKRNELYSSLQKAVKSGDIEEGSEEWHKMVEEINNVDLEIKKANTSLIEFNNSIREIQWQVFDLLQNKISQITKESDFLINLMKNDNLYVKEGQKAGQFTNEGLSTVGLHGVNYNVYMAQAGKYAEEILKIDKQLANDPYNQDLANRRKELLELQQSMILSAEEEKQAIVNMVKEGINLELNALKKLIDKYNEALNSQKDLYDYQKKIKDQTKELTSLQKQLSAYAGDTSEETKAKIQKLQVSISEAKENLEETQYNQFISDHKKLLDNLYNEYEKVLNQRLDNVDGLISDMIANVNDNANTIKQTITEQSGSVGYNISSTMNDIWNNGTKPVLSEYNRNFINVSSNVITAINGLTNSINTMISKLDRAASSSNDVKTMTNEPTVGVNKDTPKVPDNSKNNNSNNNSSSNSGTNNNNSNNNSNNNLNNNSNNNNNKNNSNNKQGKKNNTKKRTDKENYGVALAIINGNYGWGSGDERKRKLEEKKFNYSKVQGIVNKLWDEGLVHSNAWIGKYYGIRELSPYHYKNFKLGTNRVNRNQLAWTQENNSLEAIIRPSDGAILTPLAREDMVLNSKATANIFDMANNPNKFIKESLFSNERFNKIPNINNTNNFSVSIDNVNFNLPNVKNYEEFFYAAQHDKRFEKMVQAMTVDKLFGGSSLKKFHI